jgi:hypothetical protein
VQADSFDQIAAWASEILTKSDARPKGVEIWQGEERLASFGTAFRPTRSRTPRSSNKKSAKRTGFNTKLGDRSCHTEHQLSWVGKLLRRVLG